MLHPALISGALLGWGLGANDTASVFGTAVATREVKYSTAVVLTSVFVIAGALVNGHRGVNKLSTYAYNGGIDTPAMAFIVMLAAAISVILLLTILKLPISTSQSVIGAIIGQGILAGKADFSATAVFLSAWIINPLGALVIAFILYKLMEKYIEGRIQNIITHDILIKVGYYAVGIFGAYSLGANNVANVTSVYAGKLNLITTQQAVLLGGISIALGVLTYSKPIMYTVGSGLTQLSPFSGLLSMLASAITVYIYALLGIPVSSSQAVVGAVVGIGLVKGVKNINLKVIRNILFGWFGTPAIAGIISLILTFVYRSYIL